MAVAFRWQGQGGPGWGPALSFPGSCVTAALLLLSSAGLPARELGEAPRAVFPHSISTQAGHVPTRGDGDADTSPGPRAAPQLSRPRTRSLESSGR